jgi:hypothetical protein
MLSCSIFVVANEIPSNYLRGLGLVLAYQRPALALDIELDICSSAKDYKKGDDYLVYSCSRMKHRDTSWQILVVILEHILLRWLLNNTIGMRNWHTFELTKA